MTNSTVSGEKHCTVDVIVELTERTRENSKNVINFFLDLRKAFDTSDHVLLLKKLEVDGLRNH